MGEWKQVLVSFKRWVKALFAEISAAFSEEEPPRQSPPGKGTVPNVETSPFLNCGDLAPIIESLTAPRYWDFSRFRRVLIALATAGEANYVPAHNRPDAIDLTGFGPTFTEMEEKSKGKERGRTIFADIKRGTLVFGRESVGTVNHVNINMVPQPGRELYQRCIGMLHVHPEQQADSLMGGMGFSDIDYGSFVCNPQLIIAVITYRANIFLMLKTTATSKSIPESWARRTTATIIQDLRQTHHGQPDVLLLADFNKEACMMFGLTLYYANAASKLCATRVEVTK